MVSFLKYHANHSMEVDSDIVDRIKTKVLVANHDFDINTLKFKW